MDERPEGPDTETPEELHGESVDERVAGHVPASTAASTRAEGSRAATTVREVAAAARRRWRGGLGLVVIAALSCAAVVVVSDDNNGVRVVETGFSVLSDPYHDISYGVVIENTTDNVAYHTIACVELRIDANEDNGCQRFTVEVLLPGQRVGFGAADRLYGDRRNVSGISVEVRGPATWEDPDEYQRGEIVASNLNVAYSPENHPVVSFDRQSGYQFDVVRNATAYAILRNDNDEIIGASGIDLDVPVQPNERVRHSIIHEASVPDTATAEVYIFPSGV
jgi:hypothetical protein